MTLPKNLLAVSLTPLNKFFGGVVDTGNKFKDFWLLMAGINDTVEKCYRRCDNCSPVSLIPAKNLSPVSLSLVIIVHNHEKKKLK
jgi:hypothetical protein